VDRCGNISTCGFNVAVLPCVEIFEEGFSCIGTNGIDSYRFCVRNRTGHDLGYLTAVDLPAGVSLTPYFLPLTPPLPPGQSRCVTLALSGLGGRTNLCFRLKAHSPNFEECCIIEHCMAVTLTPPTLACPQNIVVPCATNGGAFVTYPLPTLATGSCPVVSLSCAPPSGSFFTEGVGMVNCLAVDAAGRTGQCSFLVTVMPCPTRTNCCDNCVEPFLLSVTVTVQPGYNFLVNPLCHGAANTVGAILPGIDGMTVTKFDKLTQTYIDPFTYDSGIGGWVDGNFDPAPGTPLPPGEGFLLNNPGAAFTLTFTGCEPDCPLPCAPTNEFWLIGRVGTGAGTYTNLFRCPPECGTTVNLFDPSKQSFDTYTFFNGAWGPSTPVWAAGTSVFVSVQPNVLCPDPCVTNVPGMVAWWRGETNALDSVGPSHGTLRNGASYDVGQVGGAFKFDGVDDYVDIGNPTAVQLTSAITLEAWVNTEVMFNGQVAAVMSKWNQNVTNDCYTLSLVKQSGTIQVACGIGNGSTDSGLLGGSFAENTWTHVAATYDAVTQVRRVFVNGVLVGSGLRPHLPGGGIVNSGARLFLGREESYLPRPFKGRIDEASLYNRALAECEILAIYQAGAGGKCAMQPSPNCPPCPNPLQLVCPSDLEVANDPGLCLASVQYVPPSVVGGCSSNVSVICVPPSGVFPVGTNIVTCTATNGVGQSVQCTFRVIVRDLEPPQVTCATNVVTVPLAAGCQLRVPRIQPLGISPPARAPSVEKIARPRN